MIRMNRSRIWVLAIVVLLVSLAVAHAMGDDPRENPDSPQQVAQDKTTGDSWVNTANPESAAAAVIFTDCRQEKRREAGPGMVPMLGGHKARVMPQKSMKAAEMAMEPALTPAPSGQDAVAPPIDTAPPVSKPKETGQSIYLSNDDSMSLSSAQRIEYAINNFQPIPPSQLRPHEFLNYYKFEHNPVKAGDTFSVKAELTPGISRDETTLALSVTGRTVTMKDRRPAVITFVIDQSGSMSSANKMSYLQRGMKQVYKQLKSGDRVNVVQFNHSICVPLEGFVVGRDDQALFNKTVDFLESWGSTNLHDGMVKGYELAEKHYAKDLNNRVIMITDAIANTGIVNKDLSSTVTKFYDSKNIALSGIGVGHDFNDDLLNQLTEKGKGAYLFLASESAVDRVFGDKFVSLLEVVARDVHFKLTLPPSLKLSVFYGEESSEKKEDVQAIHYFANSSQLFLSDLKGEPKPGDELRLDIEYTEPVSGRNQIAAFSWKAGNISKKPSPMINKARLIMAFTDLIGETCPATWTGWQCGVWPCYRKLFPPRPLPPEPGIPRPPRMEKERAAKICAYYTQKIDGLAAGLPKDGEIDHIIALKEKYCVRFTGTP